MEKNFVKKIVMISPVFPSFLIFLVSASPRQSDSVPAIAWSHWWPLPAITVKEKNSISVAKGKKALIRVRLDQSIWEKYYPNPTKRLSPCFGREFITVYFQCTALGAGALVGWGADRCAVEWHGLGMLHIRVL